MLAASWPPALILIAPAITVVLALLLVVAVRREQAERRAGRLAKGEAVRPAWTAVSVVLSGIVCFVSAAAALALSGLTALALRPPSPSAHGTVFRLIGMAACVSATSVLIGFLWLAVARAGTVRRAAARLMLVCGWLGVTLALGLPLYLRDVVSERSGVCLYHAKELALALRMYADDNDARLPPATDWQGVLEHYCRGSATFTCPEAPGMASAYAYNSALAGVAYPGLAIPGDVIGIFESDAGPNAAGGPELLPDEPRHYGGDNFSFPDGHAAWIARARANAGNARGKPIWLREPQKPVRWQP
jgi:hypothetical protein